MPTMPRAACSEPLCSIPAFVKGKCPQHAKQYDRSIKDRTKYRWVYNDPRWRGLRKQVRKEQPICAVPGCNLLWTDLDHITPLAYDDSRPFDRTNVNGLCKKHHSEKTRSEVFGFKG